MTPDTDETRTRAQEMGARITDYLIGGGSWNPELADHNAVCQLLRDCRHELASLTARLHQVEQEREEAISERDRMFAVLGDASPKSLKVWCESVEELRQLRERADTAERERDEARRERDELTYRLLCIADPFRLIGNGLSACVFCSAVRGMRRHAEFCLWKIAQSDRFSTSLRDARETEIRETYEAAWVDGACWAHRSGMSPADDHRNRATRIAEAFTAYQETQKTEKEPK